jgi:hypothetical protein
VNKEYAGRPIECGREGVSGVEEAPLLPNLAAPVIYNDDNLFFVLLLSIAFMGLTKFFEIILNNFVYCLKKCKVCTVFTDSTHE